MGLRCQLMNAWFSSCAWELFSVSTFGGGVRQFLVLWCTELDANHLSVLFLSVTLLQTILSGKVRAWGVARGPQEMAGWRRGPAGPGGLAASKSSLALEQVLWILADRDTGCEWSPAARQEGQSVPRGGVLEARTGSTGLVRKEHFQLS